MFNENKCWDWNESKRRQTYHCPWKSMDGKNIGNKLKRGKCTSQIMRLHARLPRQIAPLTSNSLWDNLKESYFDNIVKATLVYVEDEEDMEKRSNANIFGFDIKRNVNIEIGSSVIEKDQESKAARTRNHK